MDTNMYSVLISSMITSLQDMVTAILHTYAQEITVGALVLGAIMVIDIGLATISRFMGETHYDTSGNVYMSHDDYWDDNEFWGAW